MRAITYCSFAEPGRCTGVVILDGELDPVQAALQARGRGGRQLMLLDPPRGGCMRWGLCDLPDDAVGGGS